MKTNLLRLLVLGGCLAALPAMAYPPSPYHLIYGCVRDQYGTPLFSADCQIVLQTSTGIQLQADVSPGLGAGINYALVVPMDAGLTPDLYQPTALKVAAPFKVFVVSGRTTNLPIQMTGNFVNLGQPGKKTRLDLTLGVDANGDGLPDAWELAFLVALGLDMNLSDLNANIDLTGSGRTLRDEFILGNVLYNPADAFSIRVVDFNGGSPILEFVSMTARSYAVLGSPDLTHWTTLSFTLPSEGTGLQHTFFYAPSINTVQVQVVQPASGPPMNFFRLVLQ